MAAMKKCCFGDLMLLFSSHLCFFITFSQAAESGIPGPQGDKITLQFPVVAEIRFYTTLNNS